MEPPRRTTSRAAPRSHVVRRAEKEEGLSETAPVTVADERELYTPDRRMEKKGKARGNEALPVYAPDVHRRLWL